MCVCELSVSGRKVLGRISVWRGMDMVPVQLKMAIEGPVTLKA